MTRDQMTILSAKAIGLKVGYSNNFGGLTVGEPYSRGEYEWNPLFSSSDALMLAAMTGQAIFIDLPHDRPTYASSGAFSKKHGKDKLDAVRWVITRYAAEIGKAMS